ncbi:MAG: HD domain-containing protein [Gemmatimonadota bacterium]|nr:HD domain-containing protein [Gemmatimonadota bacterium]
MTFESQERIIRDPLWNTIRLDPTAVRIVDTNAFQRQRYIRQLGFAHLVYPGATHTRFDHAVGVYHLAVTALRLLKERGGIPEEIWRGSELVPYAALLHDIGHYAFSHVLEEMGSDLLPGDHEAISARFFTSPELGEALSTLGEGAPQRIHSLIQGRSDHPLRGLVSGSLDLDKMDYLRRDARFCGVPYGEVDIDRLLQGLVVLDDPETGQPEVGVHEKAVTALESLLFAKYQMFRNVYWHHGVRAAAALYKRIVNEAVREKILDPEELVGPTDEEFIYETARRARESKTPIGERLATRWIPALKARKLPKRALEVTAAELGDRVVEDWVHSETSLKREAEDTLAQEVGLESGEVVIDFPAKRTMFQLNLLIKRRKGQVERLGPDGLPGLIDLPRVAEELYASTRVLRVFTFERRLLDRNKVLERITRPA